VVEGREGWPHLLTGQHLDLLVWGGEHLLGQGVGHLQVEKGEGAGGPGSAGMGAELHNKGYFLDKTHGGW
jgi:hypothetical protein